MTLKTRIRVSLEAHATEPMPIGIIARMAAQQLEGYLVAHPEIIHDVTTVGDVARRKCAYLLDISIKDRHDPA